MGSSVVLAGGLLLLESLFWGLANPIIKVGAPNIGPFMLIALRFSVALAAILLFAGKRVIRRLRNIRLWPCLLVSFFSALSYTLGVCAIKLTRTTTAGFLVGIAVLFTPFLEPVILRTKFNPRVLPLALLVSVGMYLMCGGGEFAFGLGEALAVVCSLAFAVVLTLTEKYIPEQDPLALSAMQCAVATVLGLLCALLFERPLDFAAYTVADVGSVLYLGLFGTCFCCLIQNWALNHVPATFASLAFCMEPVFSALFVYFIIPGDRLDAGGLLGAAIIMIGIGAASLLQLRGNRVN